MRYLAKRLGLSVTTVSYALRNDPRVNSVTRERILALAKELDYQPDPALSILNEYRRQIASKHFTGTLAFLSNFNDVDPNDDGHYITQYYLGAIAAAKALGYSVAWFKTCDKSLSGRRLSNILEARGVRGVIISPLPEGSELIDLDWRKFSVVRIGYSVKNPQFHRVSSDQFKCMYLCVAGLYELGYRRIGLLDLEPERTEFRFLGAFLAARRRLGLPRVSLLDTQNVPGEELLNWIHEEKIDAIIGSSYSNLIRIKSLCLDKLAFALPYTCTDQSIACADENWFQVGSVCASVLVASICRNERGVPELPYTYMIEPVWRKNQVLSRG